MKLLSSSVVVILLLAAATTSRADDASAVEGTWLAVTAELGGVRHPPAAVTNIVLKIAKGKYEVLVDGHPDKGTCKMDASAKPKTMDITGTEGPNAGRHIPAIYELTGDKLKICYGLKSSVRPTEFKTHAGTQEFLVVYQRKK